MKSRISGPCCDSDIKPDQYKNLVWESHVRQQISSSLKMFIVKGNKIQLGLDNKYPENNQACQDSVKYGENCTDEWFYFLCSVIILWVKLC